MLGIAKLFVSLGAKKNRCFGKLRDTPQAIKLHFFGRGNSNRQHVCIYRVCTFAQSVELMKSGNCGWKQKGKKVFDFSSELT